MFEREQIAFDVGRAAALAILEGLREVASDSTITSWLDLRIAAITRE